MRDKLIASESSQYQEQYQTSPVPAGVQTSEREQSQKGRVTAAAAMGKAPPRRTQEQQGS